MVCVKCGFNQGVEVSNVCAKCGAVQEKVKQFLKSKISALTVTCEEVIALNNSTMERIGKLKSEVDNNEANVDCSVLVEPHQKLERMLDEAAKLAKNLDNLMAYIKAVKTEFQASEKISKAIEYLDTYKSRAATLVTELHETAESFEKSAVKNDAVLGAEEPSFRAAPQKNNVYLELINEIETGLTSDRYPALGTMATLYGFLAWLFILVFVAAGIFLVIDKHLPWNIKALGLFATTVLGAVTVISIMAVSESIKLGVAIEKNSRATMAYMKVLVEKVVLDK